MLRRLLPPLRRHKELMAACSRMRLPCIAAATCVALVAAAMVTARQPSAQAELPQDQRQVDPYVVAGIGTAFTEMVAGQLWKRELVAKGRVPYLSELSEYRLASTNGSATPSQVHDADTAVYFGLEGRCTLSVWGGASSSNTGEHILLLSRGAAAIIYPGTRHQLSHPGEGADACLVLKVLQGSGSFRARSVRPGLETYSFGDAATLPSVKTAHDSDLLSKKVYLAHGIIPGLFQVSLARFAPGAECEEHTHRSAAEVYVNYDGLGCHLKVHDTGGRPHIYDLTGGQVAIINPGTLHSAWNDASEACQNINMMIGPPNE